MVMRNIVGGARGHMPRPRPRPQSGTLIDEKPKAPPSAPPIAPPPAPPP